jgi:uncharacterized protein (DUF2062 family)
MSSKVCIFIKSWDENDFIKIKKISELKYPIIIPAEYLQKFENSDYFLSLFLENQIQILSRDVDIKSSDLSVVIDSCVKTQITHLIVLENLSDNLIDQLQQLPQLLEHDDVALFNFINKANDDNKKVNLLSRMMNCEGIDYRSYWTKNNIYSLKHIVPNKNKYQSELEILVQLLKAKNKIVPLYINEVPSALLKKHQKKTMKNFFYELYLTIYSSLMGNISPTRAGLSFSMGIFIACTPFYGFQTLLIICLAILFRLNFPIAYLSSQISLPPFYVLLIPLQLYVGQFVLNKPFLLSGNYLQVAQENFNTWLIGSLIVGFALSSISGYLWYLVQSRFNKAKLREKNV